MNSVQLAPAAASGTAKFPAISKISSKVWMEIFKWTLDGQLPFDISQTQEGPWLLGHVCSAWRVLVVGRSPLWTNFKLDVPRRSSIRVTVPSAQCYYDLLQSVLDRSGGLSLTFSLTIDERSTGIMLIPILVREIKRWKSACIIAHCSILRLISDEYTESNIEDGPTAETTLVLELIDLRAFDDTQGLWMWSGEIFRDTPRLHSVLLLRVFMEDIPWEQLTDLCIGKALFSDVLNILSHCDKLRRLRLPRGFVTEDEDELVHSSSSSEGSVVTSPEPEEEALAPEEGYFFGEAHRSKITLADLQELELFNPEILGHLHVPSSKILTIKATLVYDPDLAALNDFTTLSNFFTSCSTIRVLDVAIFGFDVKFLVELFPLMLEIQDLQVKVCSSEVTFQGGADHLLDSLKSGLLMLKKLTLDGEGVLFSEEKLREVLNTREVEGCGLSRVKISSSPSICSDN
ncbi:hypothetical protein EDD18DRAFT_1343962 [Armillaria luteobubalina]|uniref:F-box domain-containing protein n=1 Tax=Armillaria luteobubalina TaxID=153913 RepID=A0AA39UZV3_9AGAR|nr:hypothetical protein EDD18DRAFT_1343962 [Armillaria luteobubalina]